MRTLAITDRTGPPPGRSDVVICLDAGRDAVAGADALTGLLATLAPGVTVVIHGDGGVMAQITKRLAGGEERPPVEGVPDIWCAVDIEPGDGLATVAAAMAPADLVLLGAGSRLAPGWLEELSAAARSDLVIATASGLDAGLLDGQAGLIPAGLGSVEPGSLPRLEAPVGPCVYVRRSAMELAAGPLGPAWAARARDCGLAHVLAGTVVIAGAPSAGFERGGTGGSAEPLERARLAARAAKGELAVIIDARELDGPPNGTRVHLCALIAAVAGAGTVNLTALLPAQIDADTSRLLDAIAGVTRVAVDAAGRPPAGLRADVVHRPHQIHSPADLALLASLAPRLVITQQDLIEFHAPGYFASEDAWRGYRELTRVALASADRVLFFSQHARAEALAEELVDAARADVVPLGTDHALGGARVTPVPPTALVGLAADAEVLLCLGTDMRHKNRTFALALAAELRRAHGWQGTLVFAGPHVGHGSSQSAEAAMVAADPGLAGAVRDLGLVSDAERRWLLEHAALVLYPTVHEGFGLVPYEAAAHGVPCLWAPGTALAEMLGDGQGGITPWDPVTTAQHALELMRDDAARAEQVAGVLAAGRALSWAATGRGIVDAYRAACHGPAAPAAAIARASGLMSGAVSPDGIRLVGPDGLLPSDAERPLLAVLSRPRLASPVLGALRYGYRLARRNAADR